MTRTVRQWRETLKRLARGGPRAAPLADRVHQALAGACAGDDDALTLELADDEARILEHVAPLSALWTPSEVVPPQSAPATARDGGAGRATAEAVDAWIRTQQRK
jgi:hypothetical protein